MTRRFNHIASPEARFFLVERLSDPALLGRAGSTMRQGPYVLPYPPDQEEEARELIDAMIARDLPPRGVRAAAADLYDIALEHLDAAGLWEALCEEEPNIPRDELSVMLGDVVDMREVVVPAVERIARESGCDLLFITGTGATFPFLRTHTLLTELSVGVPVVLAFPGSYRKGADGSTSLDILDIPSAGNGGWYRATNVFDL